MIYSTLYDSVAACCMSNSGLALILGVFLVVLVVVVVVVAVAAAAAAAAVSVVASRLLCS
jgi:hypothetical protein